MENLKKKKIHPRFITDTSDPPCRIPSNGQPTHLQTSQLSLRWLLQVRGRLHKPTLCICVSVRLFVCSGQTWNKLKSGVYLSMAQSPSDVLSHCQPVISPGPYLEQQTGHFCCLRHGWRSWKTRMTPMLSPPVRSCSYWENIHTDMYVYIKDTQTSCRYTHTHFSSSSCS